MQLKTEVRLIEPFEDDLNIYYVRDKFGRTWQTVASSYQNAKSNIKHGEDVFTFILYSTSMLGESLPQYDFKNMVLDMLEKMDLLNTYEYEKVIEWDNEVVLSFIKASSLRPYNLLVEINKFEQSLKVRE